MPDFPWHVTFENYLPLSLYEDSYNCVNKISCFLTVTFMSEQIFTDFQ